jgi:hypothetical protein
MALNTPPDRFGGVRNPLQPGGIYIAKVVREHGNGTVTVNVKTLGSTLGPIKVVNYTPSTVPTVGEQVIVSFLDNLLNDMVVLGRLSTRVDELSIADNLIVDSSTSDALVRFTQRGSGNTLLVEDSTNPDSTPFAVDSSGRLLVGNTSSVTVGLVTPQVQVSGSLSSNSALSSARYSADNGSARLILAKSRNTTVGSHTAVIAVDELGRIDFYGSDGTSFKNSASIISFVEDTVSTNIVPSGLRFYTTDSAGTFAERVRITPFGAVGIGQTPGTGRSFLIGGNLNAAVSGNYIGAAHLGTLQSNVTGVAYGFNTAIGTAAAAFTVSRIDHFRVDQGTFGAGSTVTNQYGFFVESTMTGATNNYGFYGNIASGTGRYNLYMAGTANNYLAGSLSIGALPNSTVGLYHMKTITGGTNSYGVYVGSAIQSDVTGSANVFSSVPATQAASFTLGTLSHFKAIQGTIGAGSTVSNQIGFIADSTLTGATNNYGFYGNIASGSGRWNMYMAGTADNYLAGSLGIGTTSPATALDVVGTATVRAAATQDGIALIGRAGGTSSYEVIITPTTLTADRTLTLPNVSGTVVTTGDTGSITSTMISDGTIVNGDISSSAAIAYSKLSLTGSVVNADISSSAAIADTKLATISTASKVSNSATTATSSNTASAIVARDASGNFTAGTVTAALSGNASTSTKASTLAQNGGSGTGMTFNWSGQSGQPTWLWGSNDGTNIYVWNPSNFSVSTAYVATYASVANGSGISYPGATVGGGAANNIGFRWANPVVNCTVDNVISAEAANFSDRRLKTNISDYLGGLIAVRNIRPVKFNPLDITSFDEVTGEPIVGDNDPYDEMVGFIADELAEVIPSAVSGTGSQLKSVSTLQVLSVAVAAIKELDAKVTSLMERIETLENGQ